MNYNIYEEKNLENPKTMEIKDNLFVKKLGDNAVIEVRHCRKKNDTYYSVMFKTKEKEFFLGKFSDEYENLKVQYYEGKILICTYMYDGVSQMDKVDQVLSLYEILDDTFYSCTEEEALKLFDPFIDRSFLKNKDRLINRTDSEKKRKLK